ncbi:hypothetical protein PIB30_089113, partial [Stylosanthes scabra]|nr:hypothetical protein [Stylosanthes scabra]
VICPDLPLPSRTIRPFFLTITHLHRSLPAPHCCYSSPPTRRFSTPSHLRCSLLVTDSSLVTTSWSDRR